MTRAVILWPPDADPDLLRLCLAHCRRHRYQLDSLAPDWAHAAAATAAGLADVLLVAHSAMLDPWR